MGSLEGTLCLLNFTVLQYSNSCPVLGFSQLSEWALGPIEVIPVIGFSRVQKWVVGYGSWGRGDT